MRFWYDMKIQKQKQKQKQKQRIKTNQSTQQQQQLKWDNDKSTIIIQYFEGKYLLQK